MIRSNWLRQSAIALAIVAMAGTFALAQRGGGGGRGGFGGFGGGPGGGFGGFGRAANPASFALRDDVKKELGLSDDTVKDLEEISQSGPDMREMMQSLGNFRDMSADERQEAMTEVREKMEKENKKLRESTMAALSSKQKDRFAELQFQFALTNGNAVGALKEAEVDLSTDDEEQLQDAMREVNRQVQERVAAIRLELQMEALSEVVSSSKLESMIGEKFVFEATRGRGGPGGAFGRQGGRGGALGGGNRGAGARGGNNARRARPTGDDDDDSGAANPRRGRGR